MQPRVAAEEDCRNVLLLGIRIRRYWALSGTRGLGGLATASPAQPYHRFPSKKTLPKKEHALSLAKNPGFLLHFVSSGILGRKVRVFLLHSRSRDQKCAVGSFRERKHKQNKAFLLQKSRRASRARMPIKRNGFCIGNQGILIFLPES